MKSKKVLSILMSLCIFIQYILATSFLVVAEPLDETITSVVYMREIAPISNITPLLIYPEVSEKYSGEIQWAEKDGEEAVTGKFAENKVYIATIKLSAKDGYTFAADFNKNNIVDLERDKSITDFTVRRDSDSLITITLTYAKTFSTWLCKLEGTGSSGGWKNLKRGYGGSNNEDSSSIVTVEYDIVRRSDKANNWIIFSGYGQTGTSTAVQSSLMSVSSLGKGVTGSNGFTAYNGSSAPGAVIGADTAKTYHVKFEMDTTNSKTSIWIKEEGADAVTQIADNYSPRGTSGGVSTNGLGAINFYSGDNLQPETTADYIKNITVNGEPQGIMEKEEESVAIHNLYANGGFETVINDTNDEKYGNLQEAQISSTGKTIADFWPDGRVYPIYYEANNASGSFVFNSDTVNVKEGNKSLKMTMNGSNRYVILRASENLVYGKKHKLSFWYKTENLSTSATGSNGPLLRREFVNASWGGASRTALLDIPTNTDDTDWKHYETEFTAPVSGNNNFQITMQVANHSASGNTTGSFWIDDLMLYEMPQAETVTITPQKAEIAEFAEIQLTSVVSPVLASQSVIWSSTNTTVASVDTAGKVKGLMSGEAVIIATATDGSGITGECNITVKADLPPSNAKEALSRVGKIPPTIVDDKLVFPQIADGYELSLYGSDNQQVIKMDGTIIQPLVDMDVNLLYKATNKSNPEDVATNWEDSGVTLGSYGNRDYRGADINITVPGKYSMLSGDNPVPDVIPGLREWKGSTGTFEMTDESKIILDAGSENIAETADVIKTYFKNMLNRDVTIITGGTPMAGDILLKKDGVTSELGKEGYLLDIGSYVTISAPENIGILYGGISIMQIMYQSDDYGVIPKGIARDYPKYPIRSGMIDVGRMYIPLEYVEEMTMYMAWFKLNEARIHINDYWKNANNYQAFRVESKKFPSITAKDGYFSQEDYKAYQLKAQKFGIDIITEIDTPYHAECFRAVNDNGVDLPFLDTPGYMDITTDENRLKVQNFISDLFDEFLDGPDPLVKSTKFHVGTDEYDKKYSEQMRKYTDFLIKYVNDKGYESRVWGSIGKNGFNGTTPVTNEAVMNLWAHYWTDVKEMYDDGYDIINTCGGWLYIVPAANAGYPDYLPISEYYDSFDVNNFNPSRNRSTGVAIMPIAHPQTKGAEFCIWNDMTAFKGGFSWHDVYNRFKDAVVLTSEKTWYGEKTNGQTSEQFMKRVEKLNTKAGGSNPGSYVDSKTDLVFSADKFTLENDGVTIKDNSGNGYDALVVNGTNADDKKGVSFSGDGYIEFPMDSMGYPYTVFMDVNLSSDTPANTEFFSGSDGVMAPYDLWNDTGKMGYYRGSEGTAYSFLFDYFMPKNRWVSLAIVGDKINTTLYIDGEKVSTGASQVVPINGRKDSNTFILPLEKIFKNGIGTVGELEMYNRAFDGGEIAKRYGLTNDNIALYKNTTASSVHPSLPNCTPGKAVDGIVDTVNKSDYRWASQRATGVDGDYNSEYGPTEQWWKVDLEQSENIGDIVINWEGGCATEYIIKGSLDDNEYFEIATVTNGTSGEKKFTDINKKARYLKVDCLKPYNGNWGYSIYDFEVYKSKYDPDSVYILDVVNPPNATLDMSTISATVDSSVTKLTPNFVVTDGAEWKLYSDSMFKNEIISKEMNLDIGNNTAFIKLSSANATRLYVLNVTRIVTGTTNSSDPLPWYSQNTYYDGFHNNFGEFTGDIVTLDFNITPTELPNAKGVGIVLDGSPAAGPDSGSNTTGATAWAPIVIRIAQNKIDVHNGSVAGTWLGNGTITKDVDFNLKVVVDRVNSKFKVYLDGTAIFNGWASYRRQTPAKLDDISMVYLGGSGIANDLKINSFSVSESPATVEVPVYVMDTNCKKLAGLEYNGTGTIYETRLEEIGKKVIIYAPDVKGYNIVGKSSATIESIDQNSAVLFVYKEEIKADADVSLSFKTPPTLTKGTVSATVTKYSDKEMSMFLIMALYDSNNVLKSMEYKPIVMNQNEIENFEIDFTYQAESGDTVKAFMWEGISLGNSSMRPMCNPVGYTFN